MLRVERLKCEHLIKPCGIENKNPVFSWILKSDSKNVLQTAYQVKVYTGNDCFWDSEKQITDNSIECIYEGMELQPLTEYYWRVTVWDNQGEEVWAESSFMTARFNQPWRASWVEPEQTPTSVVKADSQNAEKLMAIKECVRALEEYADFQPVQYMRIPFTVKKEVKRMLVCATAHGIYELAVNGQEADNRLFAPEISAYQKILQYQVYDVTKKIRTGENLISIKLGDGWWCGRIGVLGNACQFGNTTAFLLEGQIEYTDGSLDYVLSDAAVSSTGPLLVADLFVGEKYDARKEIEGWETTEFDDSTWKPVRKLEYQMDNLIAQYGSPVRVIKSFKPRAIFTDPKGDVVIDLGQNIAGFMSFMVKANEGTVIRMEHAEVLDKLGCFYKNIMGENKDQMDVYIAKEGCQTYRPVFTYHGFRYVRLTGWPGMPSVDEFMAHVVSTDVEDLCTFETSNPKLNRLQQNIWWSQVANTVSIPTDCPQREKAGWSGDVTVYAPTMCFLRDEEVFLSNWLRDCRAEQLEDGEIPTVIPFLPCYRELNLYYGTDTSCGWGDAIVSVPWSVYMAYGNKAVLAENYGAMIKWMQYVQHCAETEMPEGYESFDETRKARQKYLWNTGFHYGDWLVPSMVVNTTDDMAMINTAYATKGVVAPAFYAFNTELMYRIAETLGRKEDAAYYAALNKKVCQAFIDEYVNDNGHIETDMQGIYVLALKNNLISDELRQKVSARLQEKIVENRGCLDTGFLSVPFLLDVLVENGCRETAYDLLYQEKCPSWLYEVECGATTIWESWGATSESGEVGKYSYNHYAYGCVGEWMYRELAGIKCIEAGYHKVRIDPAYDCRLNYVKGELNTPYGLIVVSWEKQDVQISLTVEIPVNTTAVVVVPNGQEHKVGSGTWKWDGGTKWS